MQKHIAQTYCLKRIVFFRFQNVYCFLRKYISVFFVRNILTRYSVNHAIHVFHFRYIELQFSIFLESKYDYLTAFQRYVYIPNYPILLEQHSVISHLDNHVFVIIFTRESAAFLYLKIGYTNSHFNTMICMLKW